MIDKRTWDCLSQYYRCPEPYFCSHVKGPFGSNDGHFQFAGETIRDGRCAGQELADHLLGAALNAFQNVEIKEGIAHLPFDPFQVINNLRCETYTADWRHNLPISALARIYYFFRPLLPLHIRKHLQAFYFRGWSKLKFPCWPVDCSVDDIHSKLLSLSLQTAGADRIPFIWFWPQGASSCAIMTHDVETELGAKFCPTLMDIDDLFGIKTSFQVLPEQRYNTTPEFLSSIRDRGFEIVVHGLNRVRPLHRNRKQFLAHVAKTNSYAACGAGGFRAASLHRKRLWCDTPEFSYDMSVPNVAHLDPQRGGCCTVMPYFLGNILELPVTTTQDYTLFHILGDYSIDLWKKQIEIIMEKHGLINFITHPDYIRKPQPRFIYEALLAYLSCLEEEKNVWITTSGEVNRWWRQRAGMKLVHSADGWRITGTGAERARLAYAALDRDQLVYQFEGVPTRKAQSD